MNPKDWNEDTAARCAILLIKESETKSQAVMATISFCLSLTESGCSLSAFKKVIEAHAMYCQQPQNN